ncbi:3-deoxy-manno-octulosonate cytidylyltransferase [bacterium]|jgi:3-deoxy-manno-octulosonate cytidylyltransferase (CMP-KDO synthetase)|nr:3-deoxy-manno-octulosonate cytidylyltransferase [bacterium]
MSLVGIIPARMGSSRFPGKPMEKIHGIPMVGHCFYRTAAALGVDNTYVATCDQEIYDYITSINGNAIMTSDKHTRASTRTYEALKIVESHTGKRIDIVIMVQGDEPLIKPKVIKEALLCFQDNSINIVNIMSLLKSVELFRDKNNVKVVVDKNYNALYYSREPIPSSYNLQEYVPGYMQTGIIAFRRGALLEFNSMSETRLENIESVDMNRVLENGGDIRMVLTDQETIGVDTPNELLIAEKMLVGDSILRDYL